MKKIANLSFSISGHEPVKSSPKVIEFSTQDTNTAVLRFEIKDGKEPLNLTDITGKVNLNMKDNSRFEGQAKVTDPLKGIIEYIIPSEQIKHIGKGEGELVLIKGKDKLAGLYFDFTIKPSLVDKNLNPVKEYYIADLEVVKKEVIEKAGEIHYELDTLDTRVTNVEDRIYSFEDDIAETTVIQVAEAKKDTAGQTHANLDARIKAEVGKINQKQEEVTSQLEDTAKKNEVLLKSEGVGLDNAKPDLLAAIQNKDSETTFNILSEPRPGSVNLDKLDPQTFDLTVAQTKTITNVITNGNFLSIWAVSNSTHQVNNNVGSFTATAAGGRINRALSTTNGNKYYIRAKIKADSNAVGINFAGASPISHSGNGQFETVHGINTALVTGDSTLRIHDDRPSGWTAVQVKEVLVVNLTTVYGAGNEPTATEFSNVLNKINGGVWFEGSIHERAPLEKEQTVFFDGMKFISRDTVLPLTGKKGVSFGDSVTEFGHYPAVISKKTGAEMINVGFGGARMSNHPSPGYGPFCMTKLADAIATGDFSRQIAEQNVAPGDDNTAIVNRLIAIDWNAVDFITINYGTNDFRSAIPVGDLNSPLNDQTFSGAMAYVVERIQTKYPHIQIIFVTPAWRWNDGVDADVKPNAGGVYLHEYIDVEVAMAQKLKLPVLDLYRTSGINKYTAKRYIALNEDVHLNAIGYEYLGERIGAYLNSLL